ncbi:MAG TPA: prolyl oligopeptidase family serine peptidase [Thermoanaerobaculia bacterium]|nr:prolyl oligopeptidase family serine peptidase [Thermoanaerobaculia bacterium]
MAQEDCVLGNPDGRAEAGPAPAASPRLSRRPPCEPTLKVIRTVLLGLAAAAVAGGAVADPVAPPAAPTKPVIDTYHGVRVVDDYRWLEDWNDPAVQAWSAAENAHARSVLDALPGREAIRARVTELFKAAGVSYSHLRWAGGTLFAVKDQPPQEQPFLVTATGPDDLASERVLVDPNVLDPKGGTSIDWYEPSPDGKRVAVSLSVQGSERGSAHVYEVATGKELGDLVPGVNGGTAGGSLAWAADSSGFYYSRYPSPGERSAADLQFYTQVYFHALGTSPDKDRYEIGKDFPKIGEIKLRASRDGKWVLAVVQNGDGGQCALDLRSPQGAWSRLAGFADGVSEAAFGPAGSLYLLSRAGAPGGKILRLSLHPGRKVRLAEARVVVRESAAAAIQFGFEQPDTLILSASRLYVVDEVGGPEQVRVFDLRGKPAGKLPMPKVAGVDEIVPLDGDRVLYSIRTYLEPKTWYGYAAGGSAAPRKLPISSTSPVSFADVEVVREVGISRDGVRVPLNILRRKGIPLDGKNPTLLTGYGGFGRSYTPFLPIRYRLWFDAGGVLAVANLRGGGEYGERWHRAGKLVHKQKVFDDFIASAERLIQLGYTAPARLVIEGASNGGLLMGAVMTQRPDLFRAVVSHVGIYDMLRLELQANGQFNATEYGTVKDPAQFKALYAYSPYHHVKDGTAYPPVLFMTGANDPRVDPSHSRKMTARLRAAEKGRGLVLLRTSATSGHGFGTALSEKVEQSVDTYAFILHQLGMSYPPAAPRP